MMQMRPKVLHLIHGLGGGGAERQISYLAPSLAEHGVEMHVAYVSGGSNFDRLSRSKCLLHQISASGNYDPRQYFLITRLIKYLQPNLVQTWLPQMDILGGTAALRNGIPYILSERNTGLAYKRNLKMRARQFIGARAAAIVANSVQGLEYWDFVGDHVAKVAIPNGLPISELSRFQTRETSDLDRPSNLPILLFAGRYTQAKNVELVMDTIIEVAKRRNNVIGQFFGEGPLEDTLRRNVKEANLDDRIQINGYSDNLWQRIANANVLISLSAYEGNPNIVLEAAAIGCPLVLSDIPAHREFFGRQAVRYVGGFTVAENVETILSVIDNDEATRCRVSVAREIAEEYSVEFCAVRYRDLYERLLTSV